MTDQAERLDTGQIKPDSMAATDRDDLYQQAKELYERITGRHSLGAVRAVVDLVLDSRHDRKQMNVGPVWDVLRKAAHALEAYELNGSTAYGLADRLEAEHRAAQEKAAADAKREKLIERAAVAIEAMPREGMSDNGPWADTYGIARALADAGLLAERRCPMSEHRQELIEDGLCPECDQARDSRGRCYCTEAVRDV